MSGFDGSVALLRLALRRDKILLPVCVITFGGIAWSSGAATLGLYPNEAALVQAADLINATPAIVALYGRIYDPSSLGALSVFKLIAMGTAMVGLFALLVVIRHTRADEELGRQELLASGSLGRYAPLTAALLVAVGGSVAIGCAAALGLSAAGLPLAGSLAFGLSWAVGGIAFSGAGAVVAQLTTSARAARALGIATLAGAFVLRAAGDSLGEAEPAWPTWLSPLGWAQQVRPYAGDRWLVALLPILFGAALVALAAALLQRRDLGAGLLPQRQGRGEANAALSGPVGLAWRLQRTAFFGWLAAFVLLSWVLGQIVTRVGDMLNTPAAQKLIVALGGVDKMTDAFVAVELDFVAVFAAAYGISSVLRLSAEEAALRGDLVLAGGVRRFRWVGSHLLFAAGGAAALMSACGVALGAAHAGQSGNLADLGRDLAAATVRLPAIWVLIGVAVALFGLARRAAPFAWGVLVAAFLASEIGPILDLPGWVRDLSPLAHLPRLPGGSLDAWELVALTGVAAALMALGIVAFRRRDVAVG